MIEPLLPASAIVFVALLFAAAALGKAEQFNQFAPVLSAIWPGGLSAEWASRGTYIVIGCESALAAALLAGGWKSRPVLALTAATLLVFALALVRLWLIPNRPSCGCLGLFGALGAKDGHQFGDWPETPHCCGCSDLPGRARPRQRRTRAARRLRQSGRLDPQMGFHWWNSWWSSSSSVS